MLHHRVLLSFVPSSTPEQHRSVAEALRALPATITAIEAYEVHLDDGLAEGNADLSIVATFADEAAWRSYVEHPDHVRVVREHIAPIRAAGMRLQHHDPMPE
jgi:hypothetical protein